MLTWYILRKHWPSLYDPSFVSQCQWCYTEQLSGSGLTGLAVTDKVNEGCESPVCWRAEHLVWGRGGGGTSTLYKHTCPSVPVPDEAGTLLIYAWMNCCCSGEDGTARMWLFAPVHQKTKNTLLLLFLDISNSQLRQHVCCLLRRHAWSNSGFLIFELSNFNIEQFLQVSFSCTLTYRTYTCLHISRCFF